MAEKNFSLRIGMLTEGKMTISKATRTHLIYQFIILTLLFFGLGFNELLPDRKLLVCLAILPIFCYQLLILSCCMELIPIPSWMSFLQQNDENCSTNVSSSENGNLDFEQNVTEISSLTDAKSIASLPEVCEMSPYRRRWEKSVTNLGVTPKCFDYPQRSKSWMNLSDSKSTESLSREGSLDALAYLPEVSYNSRVEKRGGKTRKREERAAKAKSWKLGVADFDISDESGFTYYKDPPTKEQDKSSSIKSSEVQEESELAKSYSFPIRQKRLETWLEMKDTNVGEMNRSSGMPYWQTVGYNLAVKYEARRRRRAISNPPRTGASEDGPQTAEKPPIENASSPIIDKPNTSFKKQAKSASACMNKLKVGFSNLMSKKREDSPDSSNSNPNKSNKTALFKLKYKNVSNQMKSKDKPPAAPEFPQFLNNDRPLIFYPKYIPFEKERFESDVKKKMKELAEEQNNLQKIK